MENTSELIHDTINKEIVIIAWVAMLIPSAIGVIIWEEFTSGMPIWWPLIHVLGLVLILIFTFIRVSLKPLRGFLLILLGIFLLGFGGGWDFGLIPYIRSTPEWINWTSSLSWSFESLATHGLRLLPAIVIIICLFITGKKRAELFLIKGTISAMVEPSRLLGMKKPEPWTKIGSIFAAIFSIGTFIFLLGNSEVTFNKFIQALPLLPVAVIIAIINGFNEEFTLRAAPLSELWTKIGKKQALLITTIYFGLGHFYGVPNGILGVFLSAFLGWFLGKSLLETKGFFWAWFIHFLPDLFIFSFYAINSIP